MQCFFFTHPCSLSLCLYTILHFIISYYYYKKTIMTKHVIHMPVPTMLLMLLVFTLTIFIYLFLFSNSETDSSDFRAIVNLLWDFSEWTEYMDMISLCFFFLSWIGFMVSGWALKCRVSKSQSLNLKTSSYRGYHIHHFFVNKIYIYAMLGSHTVALACTPNVQC